MPKEKEAFKIIPKPQQRLPLAANVPVLISLCVVVAMFIAYLVIGFRISSVTKESEAVEKQITQLEEDELEILRNELSLTARRIADFEQLFNAHEATSKVFDLFRTICHEQAYFSGLNFNREEQKINVDAVTSNFETMSEQLVILNENKDVNDPTVDKVHLDRFGRINFNLSFILSESFFKK